MRVTTQFIMAALLLFSLALSFKAGQAVERHRMISSFGRDYFHLFGLMDSFLRDGEIETVQSALQYLSAYPTFEESTLVRVTDILN